MQELWTSRIDWGPRRFICINTPSGRTYKVQMIRKEKQRMHVLTTGWTLLVIAEGLKLGQSVRFDYHGSHLELTTDEISVDDYELGFAHGDDHCTLHFLFLCVRSFDMQFVNLDLWHVMIW